MSESPIGSHLSTPAELKQRIEAERRGAPFLVYRDASGDQVLFGLDASRDRFTIGRRAESDLALDWDGEVSRLHAQLESVGQEWTLVDDGLSRNGSFVNGERIRGRRRLRDGDMVRVGKTVILFRAPSDAVQESNEVSSDSLTAAGVSPGQRRVLVALCRPLAGARYATPPSNRELAAELYLSIETVKFHLHALFELFGIERLPQHHKRAALARLALERGVVGPRDVLRPS
jgi:pSer/pThr/pTyr-binding forkhead associated (FHA) protein